MLAQRPFDQVVDPSLKGECYTCKQHGRCQLMVEVVEASTLSK